MNSDYMGILYSTATGIVLRTINPDPEFDEHLTWLEANRPEGTTLLCIEKSKVGADHANIPNLDFLIPYIKENHNVELGFGKNCGVVNPNNEVIEMVLACPVLYQKKLDKDAEHFNKNIKHPSLPDTVAHKCIYHPLINRGDTYNLATGEHIPK